MCRSAGVFRIPFPILGTDFSHLRLDKRMVTGSLLDNPTIPDQHIHGYVKGK